MKFSMLSLTLIATMGLTVHAESNSGPTICDALNAHDVTGVITMLQNGQDPNQSCIGFNNHEYAVTPIYVVTHRTPSPFSTTEKEELAYQLAKYGARPEEISRTRGSWGRKHSFTNMQLVCWASSKRVVLTMAERPGAVQAYPACATNVAASGHPLVSAQDRLDMVDRLTDLGFSSVLNGKLDGEYKSPGKLNTILFGQFPLQTKIAKLRAYDFTTDIWGPNQYLVNVLENLTTQYAPRMETAQLVLEFKNLGVDFRNPLQDGSTALEKTTCFGEISYPFTDDPLTGVLLAEGLSYNDNSGQAFSCAVANRRIDTVDYALNRGADVNQVFNSGKTPLLQAIPVSYNLQMIEFLIKRGADVNKAVGGITPLCAAKIARAQNQSTYGIEDLLISHGAEIGTCSLH